uniref:ACT domain-containing protein ACR n=1 Tax=Oryza brachyantha TaxID=4533 RepID=J3LXB5_ORYBR
MAMAAAVAAAGRVDAQDEYAKLVRGMNPPRVVIDNEASGDATVIRVDSVSSHGTLLAVVQVIADLDLVIRKAYFSSDGSWFMDVFNVTDRDGNKVLDEETISYIQTTLEAEDCYYPEVRNTVGIVPAEEYTCLEAAIERRTADGLALEVRTCDRAGLLSDVTRIFRENGLTIRRAEISSDGGEAVDTFYLSDPQGHPVEAKTIEAIRAQIGEATLRVKHNPFADAAGDRTRGGGATDDVAGSTAFLFGNLFKFYRPFQNFSLIKLYS